MDQILKLLVDADTLLDHICVSGENTYRMVDARQRLKAAYDALIQMTKEANPDG